METFRVSLLGATGTVGSKFLQILSRHTYFIVENLYASQKSAGTSLKDNLKIEDYGIKDDLLEMKIKPLDDLVFKDDADIMFSSLPKDVALTYEQELSKNGKKVITNSSALRMNDDVPIIVPEINAHHLNLVKNKKGFVIANGNCSTIGLVLSFAPIMDYVKSIVVTTQQSVSGAGYPGVPSWDILGNIIPYIHEEEEKLSLESKKILGNFNGSEIENSNIEIFATTLRVPTRESHMGSVTIDLNEDLTTEEIKRYYEKFEFKGKRDKLKLMPKKPVILRDENDRPQPVLDSYAGSGISAGMPVVVGRMRKIGKKLSYVFLVNNLVRGAAGSSILNGELALQEGLI